LAECCVFGKQSVDPFHCDPLHFEQFLLKSRNPKNQAPSSKQVSLGFGIWDLELPLHFAAQNAAGTPSSEVTGLDCRVP
jgi:hypothetical protein